MTRIVHRLFALLLAAATHAAMADELPWKLDMSPDEVRAVTAYGPYKTFRNGDLETYEGVFEGHKENFQFYFRDGRLDRIGAYLYEGTDADAAGAKWLAVRHVMARRYGSVRTPGNISPGDDVPESSATFVNRALEIARTDGKSVMAPLTPPEGVPVMATLASGMVEGKRWYYVIFAWVHP